LAVFVVIGVLSYEDFARFRFGALAYYIITAVEPLRRPLKFTGEHLTGGYKIDVIEMLDQINNITTLLTAAAIENLVFSIDREAILAAAQRAGTNTLRRAMFF